MPEEMFVKYIDVIEALPHVKLKSRDITYSIGKIVNIIIITVW